MVGGGRCSTKRTAGEWPSAVCGKSVGSSSMQCTICQQWVHKRCSGVKGSLCKASSLLHAMCLCPTDSEVLCGCW